MATIDYEKKYKALVEAVKTLKEANPSDEGIQNWVKDNVPELAESEDEKIRKEMIEILEKEAHDFPSSVIAEKSKSWIAWLEKQGKKTEPIEDFDTEFERQISHLIASAINREHEYNKGYIKWAAQSLIEYAKREIEKQGSQILANSAKTCKDEQKPIKEHDICDTCDEKASCVNPCPTKLIEEQKPVDFSELRTWKYIVDAVWTEKEGIGQYLDSPFTEEVAKKLQKRFGKIEQKPAETEKGVKGNNREIPNSEQKPADKVDQYSLPVSDNSSLPTFDESIYHPCTEEVYEQKPTEWSEEDEKMLKDTIRFCELCGNQVSSNWLKSIRPQSHWRSSEEQMLAIDTAINVLGKGTLNGKQLIELQEALKKLKQ